MPYERYTSPFEARYASAQMQYIFSAQNKFGTWRRLWVALARAEKDAGLNITDEQIAQMEAHVEDINYAAAEAREREVRHDVMAHVYAYGLQCPAAAGIIHLGATSCYVGDNTDILVMKAALLLVRQKLLGAMALLAGFARQYKAMPALAYTHLQPAQPTTVGKRAALWLHDFYLDFCEVEHRLAHLALLGSKGTTGTQASFMQLFCGDEEKVLQVEAQIAKEMGMEKIVPVSGQTYPRKQDYFVCTALSGIAQSASKFANDLRILQNFKEMEEPFEEAQIGSSAMPYKRNPMRAERICALSRYIITTSQNPAFTAVGQWFERTLDDSANRRIAVAESFLATDAVLDLVLNVCNGLVVYPKVVAARLAAELPFMATENILMQAVQAGGNRQALHERLRTHSQAAARVVKEEGEPNDLLMRIAADDAFGLALPQLQAQLAPEKYIGRAPQQVEDYLRDVIDPVLAANEKDIVPPPKLNV
ncbi:adenylosuccinate lyase [Ruminococcaceae bacterium OttesenSCG-928-O06]|nr:adenylosuccinate lyase [Ruminococcaceae bacterium OttesenSCG-928-O06]